MNNRHSGMLDLKVDTTDTTDTAFDLNFLRVLRSKYFRGGIFFNDLTTGNYQISSIIHTRTPSTAIILPNLAV